MSFFKKLFSREKEEDLDKGLEKTKEGFFSKISKAIAGKSTIDVSVLDEVENILISSDVGLETTVKIIDRIEARVAKVFGKGLVQTVRPLAYNTQLKVTTAKYYTPSGRCIQELNYAAERPSSSFASFESPSGS